MPKSDLLNRLEHATGKEKIGILNQLAGLFWDLPPNERIAFAEQAVDLSEEFHDPGSKAESYNYLGIAYNNLGDIQTSIRYFLNALQITEQIDDKNGMANSYRNLGQANFYLDNFDEALGFFQEALKLQEEIGNEQDISQALVLVGNVKAKTAAYDEAQEYYFKALTIKKGINDRHGISQIYNNLGNIYLDTGHDDRALEYRLEALQIDRELGDKWEIANSTYNIAEQYLKNKEPEEAYPYLLESRELAEDLDNKGLIRDNLHNLSVYYELSGDYQKALRYQREYSELTKSLFSEELSEKVAEMQTKYETERLEETVTERTQELQQKIRQLEETARSLRQSQQRLDLAVTGTGLGLWTWDIQDDRFKYTPQWAKMLGYSLGEIEPEFSSYRNLIHSDDEHEMMGHLNAHLEGRTPIFEAQFRMHTKSGEWKWILSTGRVFDRDTGGKPLRMTGLHRDITERVRMEEERELLLAQIRGQAKQMQQTIDTVPEGVFLLDAKGQIILANPVAEGDLAVLADAKVGEIITHLGGRPLAELLTSPPTKGLWHEIEANGRIFEVIARPIENGPEPENWVLIIREVTQEREIRRRIQQQERLTAVGQLAAGIAHDFNNIMAIIVFYTQMGLSTPNIPTQLRDRLQIVDQQAKRATDLIRQILDFSRRAVLERRPMDLTPFLKEIVKLLERTVPESIKIEFTYGRDEYKVNADPTRVQQAIMNLVVNARDAMLPEGGGELHIELDRLQVARHQEPPLPEMEAGEWVRIAVTDTGSGIPPEVLPHIFEPFYTTKELGKGTGLGLAQVYGIVKQHEGHVDVTTEVGTGTTFTLYLPALPAHQPEAPAIETRAVVQGQGETILVVEDNADLRKALAGSVASLNYRVLAAADGREALEILEQHAGEVSLVLSDLVMPEMGGQALFHAMRQRGLTQPVVMLSGHPMEKEMESLRAAFSLAGGGTEGWRSQLMDSRHSIA